MAKNTGTLVVDTIKTFDDADKYAVVNSSDIKGGHHVVDYDTDRNNLVSNYPLRTETGMLITVRSSAERGNQMTTYQLSGSSWINFADYLIGVANIWTSGATGIWYNPPVGNVGIGLSGASITAKLTVFGDSHFYNTSSDRITIDPTTSSIYNYNEILLVLSPLRFGNNIFNTGVIVRPDLSNSVGINVDSPTATLDINGSLRVRTTLLADTTSTLSGVTTHSDQIVVNHFTGGVTPSITLNNIDNGAYGVTMMYKYHNSAANYWYTGVNNLDNFLISRGSSFSGTSYITINNVGTVTIDNDLNVNTTLNIGTSTTLIDGVFNVGKTSRAANSVIRTLANSSYIAGFEAYGPSAGTGYLYVGESISNGGGIIYNGDNTPSALTPIDNVIFYRRQSGTNSAVFYFPYNSNYVYFNGGIYFNDDSTGTLYHNQAQQDINIRAGAGTTGLVGINPGFSSGDIVIYTLVGGAGGTDDIYPVYGGDGATSGILSFYTGNGGTAGGTDTIYGGNGGNSGDLILQTGTGGHSTGRYGGNSGNINIFTGNGGNGGITNGIRGDIIMQYYSSTARGNVLIGTNSNTSNRRLKVNGVGEATDWISISDIREKENISTFENALDKIIKLNPVYFNFKNGDDKSKKIGLIAQEVEIVIPELIPPTIGDSIKGVSYNTLSAVLVKAMQEQNEIIKNLKEEVNILKSKINN
jgi:hypothetical protein